MAATVAPVALPGKDLPLLAGEASIWAAEQFGAVGRPYNVQFALTYPRAEASPDEIESAVGLLVDRHPALRCRIVSERGVPSRRFDRSPSVQRLESPPDDPDGRRTVAALLDDLSTRLIDLADQLCAIYLVVGADATHAVFGHHHVTFDGRSRGLVAEELDSLVRGRPTPVEADYAADLEEALSLESAAHGQVGECLDRLQATGGLDHTLAQNDTDRYAIQHTVVHDLARTLSVAGSAKGFSVAGAFLAASATATGWGAVPTVTGMAVSTRPRSDSTSVGCFVNTVPVVVPRPPREDDLVALASQASADVREAATGRHLSWSRLQVEANRRGLAVKLDAIPLLSISAITTTAEVLLGSIRGHRPGVATNRLWLVNDAAHVGLDHSLAYASEPEGRALNENTADLLRTLALGA